MKKLILALLLLSSPAMALTPRVAAKVQQAYELYEAEMVSEAIELLEPINPRNNDDKAYVSRFRGSLYWTNGQVEKAIEQLQFAVETEALDASTNAQTHRMLADILLSQLRYEDALEHYHWVENSSADNLKTGDLYLRIAQSYYRLENWQAVIAPAKRSAELELTVTPVQMQLQAYQQLEQWPNAVTITRQLIAMEPSQLEWWRHLTSLQLRLKQHEQALTTLALAERNGVLATEKDYLSLVQLFANRQLPELAARQLQQQLGKTIEDNFEHRLKLAQYWQITQNWQQAVSAWDAVAQLDADYRLEQFELLVMHGQFEQAVALMPQLKRAIKTQDRKSRLHLQATRAYYRLGQYPKALKHAEKAARLPNSEGAGSKWRDFIQAKMV
ncbi:tetratricopeptide repeat protein [Ferrimonas lipolytica]|uniref:Tetratricopeptide repeat-containing protein n=1 Tax=Ferrimonas lipolytica TaxID=2724191 RepID=A0A6H1UEB8_9GAMM|nr:hypothetical protein [Ferrimonas lipolytica]QIZ76683.1 hypothetical protein HER31_07245 [Ferrimonas lipolytica]